MHSIVFPKAGNSNICKIIESTLTQLPNENEVVVEVKYAGINFADIMARRGTYQDAPAFPCIVGYEVSGIVKKVGSQKLNSWLGKNILCFTHFGGYSSEIIVPIHGVFEIPSKLTFEEAAAIPVNYLTAYLLIIGMGTLKSHETILIHNAGGGVGLAALQLAKHIGARIIATASKSKHSRLLQCGADHVVDYRQKHWAKEILHLTSQQGVELVVDPLGGTSWKTSYTLLRSTGRLGMFGVSNSSENKISLLKLLFQMPIFHPLSLLNNNKAVFGVNMGRLWHEPNKARFWMQEIFNLINQDKIKPTIAEIFSYRDVSKAHDYIEERKNFGKVLLKMFD